MCLGGQGEKAPVSFRERELPRGKESVGKGTVPVPE